MRNAMLAMIGAVGGDSRLGGRQSRRRRPTIIPIASRAGASASPAMLLRRPMTQCMASASGRGLYCNVNPRVAFGQQPQRRAVYRDY